MSVVSERWVINRRGEKVDLDISRIKEVIKWAAEGLDVNQVQLESEIKVRLHCGISTKEIQNNLIEAALRLTSLQNPDWRFVAGRLFLWGMLKDISINRGYGYENKEEGRSKKEEGRNNSHPSSFVTHVQNQVTKGYYDRKILDYSVEDLIEAGSWLDPARDLDYDYAGIYLLQKRYLTTDELPQEAYLVIALLLAQQEGEKCLEWAKKFYDAISLRKISLATPILAYLRRPNANLASCFIVAMEDSLESIFKTVQDVARISKHGGGVGVDATRIRAAGSWVNGVKNASKGVIPWCSVLNATSVAVDQGGKRAGAVTVALNSWHLDIEAFLEMQTENGDPRRKARDIFPQVVIHDEFMRRVEGDELWSLVDPYEIRTKLGIELAELWGEEFEEAYEKIEDAIAREELTLWREVRAKELLKQIMKVRLETGLPYILFKDEVNRRNPNNHIGQIPCGNLCQESYSNVAPNMFAHTCNLVSLNLANINREELDYFCELSVRLLDNSIDITTAPIKESTNHNTMYRTIGIGIIGLADWCAKNNLKYSHSIYEIEGLHEDIAFYSIRASHHLAKERGAYPCFSGSQWSQGRLLGRSLQEIAVYSQNFPRWSTLAKAIEEEGIRNSQILAIAPNTGSALIQGCTPSILPTFSRLHYEARAKGSIPVCPQFIKNKFWFYEENKELDQQVIVDTVAAIQRWVDTGISMEWVVNPNIGVSPKQIYEWMLSAWKQGVKALYYLRSLQKETKENCDACAN
ncbi:ribonucleoside-diphosphate reductase [Chlorogloeopsis fritschii PCC 6912]|uniref:Ribonucleoside-diphosphate reductase n=1 Tax=Chlorogloeopsis fritschii PCC 6912 TaxID=211165 RepID=A0A433N1K9_CHLFR|nr:ribonucleoside-diphosphate reductase subunit alpha [Chlorogloeopsis fritschii]RUR74900.1 ribonucleoside-diphosphate reductase [Chlorogloeopsis fritschii PCC 6912]